MIMKKIFFSLLVLVFSCSDKKVENKDSPVNYSVQKIPKPISFRDFIIVNKQNSFRLLCGYDIISVKFISDSAATLELSIFNGWKSKATEFSDTIRVKKLEEIFNKEIDDLIIKIEFESSTKKLTKLNLNMSFSSGLNSVNGSLKINEINYECNNLWYK